MISVRSTALGLALVALAAGACGSDGSSDGDGGSAGATGSGAAGASGSTGSTGTGGDPTPPADSCVQPGDHGNNLGVGEFCTPTGGECVDFPEAGLCLAAYGQWFCSQIGCDETTDCGEDAGCLITGDGSACVPCHCSDQSAQCGGGTGGGGVGGAGGSGGGAGGK